MKKQYRRKILTYIVLTVITTLCLTACTKLKTYTVEDFSIRLPEGLEQSTPELSADALLKSDDIVLLAINEPKNASGPYSSLENYAEFTHTAYQMTKECGELKKHKEYYYFRVPKAGEIRLFCMFEHNEDYWLFTLSVKSDDYDMDDVLKWMDSVAFK